MHSANSRPNSVRRASLTLFAKLAATVGAKKRNEWRWHHPLGWALLCSCWCTRFVGPPLPQTHSRWFELRVEVRGAEAQRKLYKTYVHTRYEQGNLSNICAWKVHPWYSIPYPRSIYFAFFACLNAYTYHLSTHLPTICPLFCAALLLSNTIHL